MNTTVINASLIEDKLSTMAVNVLNQDTSLLNTVWDVSAMLAQDGKKVLVPVMGAASAVQLKVEGAPFALSTTATTSVPVDVIKNAGDAFAITDQLSQAEKVNFTELKTTQIVSTLKDYVNLDILTTINTAVPLANVVGTGLTDITAALLQQAAALLDEAGAPKEDRFLVVSNTQYYKIMALIEFARKDWNTSVSVTNTNMIVGTIYGMNLIPQANAKIGQNNLAYHKSTVAFASNKRVGIESQRFALDKATNVVVDMVYGLASVTPTFSVRLFSI